MSTPYFALYGANFRDGVTKLKADEVGIYILVLTLLYDNDGSLVDCDDTIASSMSRDVRVWRRVRNRLLKLGKLELRDGRLSNPKADKVIAARSKVSSARAAAGKKGGEASGASRRAHTSREDPANFSQTSGGSFEEVSRKSGDKPLKNNDCGEAIQRQRQRQRQSMPAAASAREPPKPDVVWRQRLIEAHARFGDVLNLTTGATHHTAVLRGLCEPGTGPPCDWERDVLPAIDQLVAEFRAKPTRQLINSFALLKPIAIRNRDHRLQGLPTPETIDASPQATPRHRRGPASAIDAAMRAAAVYRRRADANDDASGLAEGQADRPRLAGAGGA